MGAAAPKSVKNKTIKQCRHLQYATCSMQGWRVNMEDAHIAISPFSQKNSEISLFGVFDGHGGAQVATFVERNLPKQLLKNGCFKKGSYELALRQTLMKMDQLLRSPKGKRQLKIIGKQMVDKENGVPRELVKGSHKVQYGGCTANICLVTAEYIYVANLGDSRAVASIKKCAKQLSFDHKPENQTEKKRITEAGGEVNAGRVNGHLNVSRGIGDLQFKSNFEINPQEQIISSEPDIITIKNEDVDFIIMGCDGIWQTKSPTDMVEWIGCKLEQGVAPQCTLERLFDDLLAPEPKQGTGCDNMSAILIKFYDKRAAWIRERKIAIDEHVL